MVTMTFVWVPSKFIPKVSYACIMRCGAEESVNYQRKKYFLLRDNQTKIKTKLLTTYQVLDDMNL